MEGILKGFSRSITPDQLKIKYKQMPSLEDEENLLQGLWK